MNTRDQVESYLNDLNQKDTLRFITCGSVDDGKSTLIGRLLYECKALYEDQLDNLAKDSLKHGTQGDQLDFALLVDGLQSEREQGITIDVAYRFFSTQSRRFIVADTPGHEQYTRNMVTGSSTADAAIILVDARKGILTQTRRHTYIASLMGIKQLIVAVNKMDCISYSKDVFNQIEFDFIDYIKDLGELNAQMIPVSGLCGDNVCELSQKMPWYQGPTLLQYLESVPITRGENSKKDFVLPIQFVNRPSSDFRGFCGRITAGSVVVGQKVKTYPSNLQANILEIIHPQNKTEAICGESVTILLDNDIDISRGDLIVSDNVEIDIADQFESKLIWFDGGSLIPGRQYILKSAYKEATAVITEIKHKIDINTGQFLATKTLSMNDIAVVNIALSKSIPYRKFSADKVLGSFILIDKETLSTVAAGMIDFALMRSHNLTWQKLEVNKQSRALMKQQTPVCIWMTGYSGSGKSTIANILEKELYVRGLHTYILDGDNVRHGLNRDLGFSEVDRVENIRRVAEVAKLMVDAGLIVIVSFISPFKSDRKMARDLFPIGEFYEVFIDTPLEECERRDVKGLYKKARNGQLKNFTGIDSPYELPDQPDLRINTHSITPSESVLTILDNIFNV